jgi:transcriptional regulator with XRE-family HTH domain
VRKRLDPEDLPAVRAIKAELVMAGVSVSEFARRLSVSTGRLSGILTGARRPGPQILRRIRAELAKLEGPE